MLDKLIGIIAPHTCLSCNREGSLLCARCREDLDAIPERCYKCLAISPGGVTCAKCRKVSPLNSVQAATPYDEIAKALVWKLKFAHAPEAVVPMADLIAKRSVFDLDSLLVPVPTATGRVRQRGYDQAELLCRAVAMKTPLPYRYYLARQGQSRQVGTGRSERARHLEKAFRVRSPKAVDGKQIMLIDDVLTTGATLEAAARALKRAGARQVDAIVFAQA